MMLNMVVESEHWVDDKKLYQSHVSYSQAVNMFKALSDKMQNLMLEPMFFLHTSWHDGKCPIIG